MRYFKISNLLLTTFSILIFFVVCSCEQQENKLNSNTSNLFKVGAGVVEFNSYEPLKNKPVNIWYYIPVKNPVNTPILFVCHGTDRNANDYRDNWIELAKKHKVIIIAPEFSDKYYPKSLGYNLGNMFDLQNKPVPEKKWSFSVIDPIFNFVVKQINGNQTFYDIFGHSAGAQFTHRFIMFKNTSKVNRIVLANAGWYTMPDFSVDFPYGLKNTSLNTTTITPILKQKVIVLLGDKDTKRTKNLRKTPEADAQGKNRYERGLTYFKTAKKLSDSKGVDFGWKQEIVPNVGHSNAKMAIAAAKILYDNN